MAQGNRDSGRARKGLHERKKKKNQISENKGYEREEECVRPGRGGQVQRGEDLLREFGSGQGGGELGRTGEREKTGENRAGFSVFEFGGKQARRQEWKKEKKKCAGRLKWEGKGGH